MVAKQNPVAILGVIVLVILAGGWNVVSQVIDAFQIKGQAKNEAVTAESNALKDECNSLTIHRSECRETANLPLVVLGMLAAVPLAALAGFLLKRMSASV